MEREPEEYKKFIKYLTEHRDCIICGQKYSSTWIKYDFSSAVICDKCGMVWLDPYLNKDGICDYYNGYGSGDYKSDRKIGLRGVQQKKDKKFIEKFLSNKKNKILDVGCSNWSFLNLFEDEKFIKFGTDIDKSINVEDDNFFCGDLISIPNNFGDFDLVILRGVIQHLSDPEKYMEKISKIIKSGGILYAGIVPNANSFCAKTYKEKWNLFDPMAYMFYFNDNTLEKFLGKYGFSLIEKDFPYIDGPYCDIERDYSNILKDIGDMHDGIAPNTSPSFWGNIINMVFKKI